MTLRALMITTRNVVSPYGEGICRLACNQGCCGVVLRRYSVVMLIVRDSYSISPFCRGTATAAMGAQDSAKDTAREVLHRFLTLHGGEEPDPAVVQYLHGLLPAQDVGSAEGRVQVPPPGQLYDLAALPYCHQTGIRILHKSTCRPD